MPASAFLGAGVGVLLPAHQHPGHDLQRLPGDPGIADLQAQLVGLLLRLDPRQLADGLEEPMLQGSGPPGRPEVEGDPGSLQEQTEKVEIHDSSPINSREGGANSHRTEGR